MMVDRAKFDTLLGLLGGYVGELRRLAALIAMAASPGDRVGSPVPGSPRQAIQR
jgi:hypothetical protein